MENHDSFAEQVPLKISPKVLKASPTPIQTWEKGKLLKKIALVMIIVLFSSSFPALASTAGSAEAPTVEWSKRYGKTRSMQGAGWLGNSVVQTKDGGFAIASTSDFGTGNDANERLWLVKTDSTGNIEWNKTFGEQRVVAVSIVQTIDDGYAILGNLIIGGYGNAWLVKTDSNGNMQWNKSYTELGWASAYGMTKTNDGGYAIAGMKESYDGWLMKTDASGTIQWSKSFVEVNNTHLQSVVQTNDGGYIAAGATQFPLFSGKVNAYVVKTDPDGNTTWSKEFSRTAGNDYGRSIVQTSDGGYAIAGDPDHWGNADFWLMKIDASGNLLWDKTFGGTGYEIADSIAQTREGGYALAGQTNSFGAGGNDLWLVKTDAGGSLQWNQTFGGAGDDGTGAIGSSVVQTRDGGYALCGYTNSFSGDGSYEVWLIKLARSGPQTWIVDDDGPADFYTIQEAINAASDGDTIFVRNGTYYEHVVLNRTLSLVGESNDSTIVDGSNNGYVVDILACNVSISQFTLQNAGSSWSGVNVESSGTMIRNNLLMDNHGGVWVRPGSMNTTISGNRISNKQPSYADGIRLWSSGTLVVGNTITNESQGIGVDESGNIIEGNLIANNTDYGIGAPKANLIFHNSLVNNGHQASPWGINIWDNGCEGNYWSDYIGTDSNGDGIGDTPYIIDTNNQDNYPLMNPYWNPADINHDLKVDLKDVYATGRAYGSEPGMPRWNPHCDINADAIIDLKDYYAVCKSFGKFYNGS
jgi:hypothetical protein